MAASPHACYALEDAVHAMMCATVVSTGSNSRSGIGLDSTSAPVRFVQNSASSVIGSMSIPYDGIVGIGYHFLAWLEFGIATATFYGDNTGTLQSGLTAVMYG